MRSGDTFLNQTKIGVASASGVYTHLTASATGNASGIAIDTEGWTGIVFIVNVHNASATSSCMISVQGAATSASCLAGASTLSGTTTLTTSGSVGGMSSGQVFVIEVNKPRHRFVRVFVERSADVVGYSANYILYGPQGFERMPTASTSTDGLGLVSSSGGTGNVTQLQVVSPAK